MRWSPLALLVALTLLGGCLRSQDFSYVCQADSDCLSGVCSAADDGVSRCQPVGSTNQSPGDAGGQEPDADDRDTANQDPDTGTDDECVVSPEDCGWEMVSAYLRHACAIHQTGALFCWGDNQHGQLGVGDDVSRSLPTQVNPGQRYRHVATAADHTCAVTLEGRMQCWGFGDHLRLGQGPEDTEPRDQPAFVGTDSDWTEAFVGLNASCGLRDQTLYCWGRLRDVLPDDDDLEFSHLPLPVTGDWDHLSMATSHQCGTQGTDLYCWGNRGTYGRLGDGSFDPTLQSTPLQIATQENWRSVDVGGQNGCAIGTDGSLWCWGEGARWKLGNGSTTHSAIPVRAGDDDDWQKVSVGGQACGIKDGGELYCWGSGFAGALGLGDEENQPEPARVDELSTGAPSLWHDIATGFFFACAIHQDRSLWCWGRHTYGVTGQGISSDDFVNTPHQVVGYEFQ